MTDHMHILHEAIVAYNDGSIYVVATCSECGYFKLRPVLAADAQELPIVGSEPVRELAPLLA